ncbi:TPA: hypothetical protein ACQNOC_000401, partial [Streptococcus pyogenes]
ALALQHQKTKLFQQMRLQLLKHVQMEQIAVVTISEGIAALSLGFTIVSETEKFTNITSKLREISH